MKDNNTLENKYNDKNDSVIEFKKNTNLSKNHKTEISTKANIKPIIKKQNNINSIKNQILSKIQNISPNNNFVHIKKIMSKNNRNFPKYKSISNILKTKNNSRINKKRRYSYEIKKILKQNIKKLIGGIIPTLLDIKYNIYLP